MAIPARADETRGREVAIAPDPLRTDFQRDRDRVIHCKAFRRLSHKTQVFLAPEGDHYRTRLTHTLEVAQLARSIARALGLNEELIEAIALAHDIGHTPFGHAGEAALNELMSTPNAKREMKKKGGHPGFEHNQHGLRVVDLLEERYAGFPGLNLTWEVREGIIKHTTSYDSPEFKEFKPDNMPTLEAQVVEYADEIAYNSHDLDDGLKSGLIHEKELEKIQPRIRDTLILLLSSKTYLDLSSLEGKQQLKQEIKQKIAALPSGRKVSDVFFTEFVAQ